MSGMLARSLALLIPVSLFAQAQPDWSKIQDETLRHFQALVRLDTTNPPGNETRAIEYVKKVLDAEGIPYKVLALQPDRANVVARLKGNGSKRPLLIMGHTDTVRVDASKWSHPPFSADREGGYIYGRGTVDDKDNLTACLMTMVLLKRLNVPLDRDVIFVAEAGEEASTSVGIDFLVNQHWSEIEAEICLAEGGNVPRRNGKVRFASIQTAEKLPQAFKLVARGPAGHGSVPLQSNAILHLSRAIDKVASWQPPVRLNDTTRYYFERLATISTPEEASRYNGILSPEKSSSIQDYFAQYEPRHASMLRTSISPNIIKGGYQVNVIPSDAEVTMDVRALPDEDMAKFIEEVKKVINDPAVDVVREARNARPKAPATRLDNDAFRTIEAMNKKHYEAITLPTMSTGATDMAFLRAKGVQCYGIGPMTDEEDGPKGFGAHSDQERILEVALHKFVQFTWDVVNGIAATKK
jgi:acetylornithine deacetylase/succinyl-diaminopimelate desuccinylase-like protein